MEERARWIGVAAWVLALGCADAKGPGTGTGMVTAGAGAGAPAAGGQVAPPVAGSTAQPAPSTSSGGRGAAGSGTPTTDATTPSPSPVDASVAGSNGDADAGIDAGEDDAQRPGWTLTFREEFDEPEGTGVDESSWTPVNRGDGFGNNELQYYTGRPENVRTDGEGSLIIEVIEEPYMGRDYTSARLESVGKVELLYGRFEIRAKLPYGQGIWPAFWLLGNDIGSVSWPQCGEIDIMEHVGRMPSTNYGSLHGPGYSGGNPLSEQYHLPDGERFADDFHEYAVEWEPEVVRWYVDGNLYETRTPDDVPEGGTWVYEHPFYMILNVAVGGPFPGSPDDTTVFPQRLMVDYVRVYSR
jgi:beta-glucanase (GH16 family)